MEFLDRFKRKLVGKKAKLYWKHKMNSDGDFLVDPNRKNGKFHINSSEYTCDKNLQDDFGLEASDDDQV